MEPTSTLVIAVIGLLLSVAALVWQATTWTLSGSRVRVQMLLGATSGSRYGTVPVSAEWRRSMENFANQGLLHRMIAAEIRNAGRAATSVIAYRIAFDTGVKLGALGAGAGLPPLPHRLEAESMVLYYLDLEQLLEALAAMHAAKQAPQKLWMEVELGSGRVRKSKSVPASLFWPPPAGAEAPP